MADQPTPEGLEPIKALLDERHLRDLENAIAGSLKGTGDSDAAVDSYFRSLHLSEGDRIILNLAYSLWRGFGPILDVQALWGMDPDVAARLVAGVAVAVNRDHPETILEQARSLLDGEAVDDGGANGAAAPDTGANGRGNPTG